MNKKILITGSVAYDTIMVFPDRFRNHLLADQLHILNVCFLTPQMRREYGGTARYDTGWQAALDALDVPLAEQLRRNSRRRAATFDRPAWRERFGRVIERVLDAPTRPRIDTLDARPRAGATAL